MSQLEPGDVVGGYRLSAPRGAGGMGSVWAAAAPDGRQVAVKLMHDHLRDDEELLKRFGREFEVGRKARHPNLVQMLESGHYRGAPFLVMELATGKSIRRLIERGGPFREWEALEIAAQVADGLAALDSHGIVHRDLKSSNIVADRDLSVKIIDFGIARVEGERTLAEGNSFMGSAEFSSPEYYFGRAPGPSADVYSLGVVLFEMLTGRVPYRSDRYTDTLKMHATLPVPRPAQYAGVVSQETDDLVFDMMQKQAERRPTARQVAARCRAILALHGRDSVPASADPQAPPVPVGYARPPATMSETGRAQNVNSGAVIAVVVSVLAGAAALVGGAILVAAMSS